MTKATTLMIALLCLTSSPGCQSDETPPKAATQKPKPPKKPDKPIKKSPQKASKKPPQPKKTPKQTQKPAPKGPRSVVVPQGARLYQRPDDKVLSWVIPSRPGNQNPLGLHFEHVKDSGDWVEVRHVPSKDRNKGHCVRDAKLRGMTVTFFVKRKALASVTRKPVSLTHDDGTRIDLSAGVMLQKTETEGVWEFMTERMRLPVALGKKSIGKTYRPAAHEPPKDSEGWTRDKARAYLQSVAVLGFMGQTVKRALGPTFPGPHGPPTIDVSAIKGSASDNDALVRLSTRCAVAVVRVPNVSLQSKSGGGGGLLASSLTGVTAVKVAPKTRLTWPDGTEATTTPDKAIAFDPTFESPEGVQCFKVPLLHHNEFDPLSNEKPLTLCAPKASITQRQKPFDGGFPWR